VLLAVAVLALVNLFGQRGETTGAAGPAASLDVKAPKNLRGGLLFTAEFDVHATRAVKRATLALSSGWFEDITLNAITPNPS